MLEQETVEGGSPAGPETADPQAALMDRSSTVRSAGCRDLGRYGTPEVLVRLVELARTDPSQAVRLAAASAAADVLSRHRHGPGARRLTGQERRRCFDQCKTMDPGDNPAIFQVLGSLDLPEVLPRLANGLRDPRVGVRVGAVVGLQRMVCSLRWCGEEGLEAQVVGLFEDARLRPDTRADLARVCLAAGFRSALPVLQRVGPREGVGAEGVEQAIAGLQAMEQEGWLDGGWISEGLDCGEVNPSPRQAPAGLYIGPEGAISIEPGAIPQCVPGPPTGLRRMSVRRPGNAAAEPMLQFAGRCWRRAGETEQAELIDQMLPVEKVDWRRPLHPGAERALLVRLASRGQPEGGVGLRNRALLSAAAGRMQEARALLEEAVEARRSPADVWLFLGELKAAAGELTGARECWEQCLRRSRRKKDWAALTAKERLG